MDRNIVDAGKIGIDGQDAEPFHEGGPAPHEPESDQQAEQEGPDQNWKFWSEQLQAALAYENRWRTEAESCEEVYFGPDNDPGKGGEADKSNEITDNVALIHGTIDVLKPLVYSQTPTPIVRRRFRGDGQAPKPEERLAAEAGQRIASYLIEDDCFDRAMEQARDDWLIAGRGQARVKYSADVQNVDIDAPDAEAAGLSPDENGAFQMPVKASEEVKAVAVEWRRFLVASGHGWQDTPWVAFEIPMTYTKVKERFGEDVANGMSFNEQGVNKKPFGGLENTDENNAGIAPETETGAKARSPFDTASVWEIWVKETGQVVWFTEGYKDGILDKSDDAFDLAEFWPCPHPLTATTKGSSLTPRPDIRYYEARAKEIDIATKKISTILEAVSVSGLFPGSMENEVKKLLNGKNELVGIQDWLGLMEKGGSGEIIQWLPLQAMVQALQALLTMRDQAKAAMFEASGVSDIMRAQGDPNETATAQQMKGRYAGLRMKERQTQMARFARDTIKLMLEVAVENFEPDYLHEICALGIPMTEFERMAIAAQNEQAMVEFRKMQQMHKAVTEMGIQRPEPQPPEMQEVPETSFEKVLEVLRNDLRRKITVNVETDSTVLADEQADKEARVEFLSAFSSFVQQLSPLIQSGQVDMKLVKELLLFGVRGFPQSRTLEGMIGELPDQPEQAGQEKDPSVQVAEIKAQVDLEVEKMQQANNEKDRKHDLRMKGVDMVDGALQNELDSTNQDPPQPPEPQQPQGGAANG